MFYLTPFEKRMNPMMSALQELENDFWGLPEKSANMFKPFKTDIKDEGNRYVLEAELPGFEKEDIKVNIEGDFLTIFAEHKTEKEETNEKDGFIRRERSYGSFKRSFDIKNINSSEIQGEYKNGLLCLSLPKKEPAEPASRQLEIK